MCALFFLSVVRSASFRNDTKVFYPFGQRLNRKRNFQSNGQVFCMIIMHCSLIAGLHSLDPLLWEEKPLSDENSHICICFFYVVNVNRTQSYKLRGVVKFKQATYTFQAYFVVLITFTTAPEILYDKTPKIHHTMFFVRCSTSRLHRFRLADSQRNSFITLTLLEE